VTYRHQPDGPPNSLSLWLSDPSGLHLETCRDLHLLLQQISPCSPLQSRVRDQCLLRVLWLLRNLHPSQVSSQELLELQDLRERLGRDPLQPPDQHHSPIQQRDPLQSPSLILKSFIQRP
jgi:hypothetical protein